MRISWGWFVLGCMGAAWQTLMPIRAGFGRGWEMLNLARELAATGRFQNPLEVLATGPTAQEPPGFPFVVSLLIRAFGDGLGLMWSATALCILAHGLYAGWLPLAGERLTGDRRAGNAAALLAVILPAFPLMPQWDTILSSAGFLAYLILAKPECSLGRGFGIGALAGFLSLWNPITAPAAALRVPFLTPGDPRKTYRRHLALLAVWGAGFLAISAPWMARNHHFLGTWALRTNLGFTLYASNNDCAAPHIFETIHSGCYDRTHPNTSASEAALLRSLGEAGFDRLRTQATYEWVKTHPRREFELATARFREFWFPGPSEQTPWAQAVWIVTVLSVFGFLAMARRRIPGWKYMLAVSIVVPVPYYFVVAGIRYRAPILWIAQITAGYLLALAFAAVRSRYARTTSKALSPEPCPQR